jgi:LysR family transcriptional regulator, benzoate and cis,cis-muconate-responsive activator of ben and cat genes
MDLKQLRYFSAVCEARSFVHAAEQINMAQPPLSRAIQNLELEIGVTLIDRSMRPLELTEAGRFLYQQGQRLLQQAEDIKQATRALGKTNRQFFNIGFVGSTLYGFLPSIIRRFKLDFPNVEVGLSEMITLQQQEALLARRIDIGFGRLELDEHPDIVRRTIHNEPLVLAVPREHKLRDASTVWLEQVAEEPFILYPSKPRPSFADLVLDLFKRHKLAPHVALEANEIQTALGLVAANIGVTLVPQSVSRLRLGDVSFLSLADSDILSPVIMGFRHDNQSALLAAFINYAELELHASTEAKHMLSQPFPTQLKK